MERGFFGRSTMLPVVGRVGEIAVRLGAWVLVDCSEGVSVCGLLDWARGWDCWIVVDSSELNDCEVSVK